MAATDAVPIPMRNVAYRVTFPIFDADGDLVTGATGLDSEVSLDAQYFADCTHEAGEIDTSSGMYYLDLEAAEMNANTVAIIVKTTSTGAKTTPIVLYPQIDGDIRVDAVQISSSTTAADRLEASLAGVVTGACAAGTLSITQATTNLTEATDDHYNGRVIVWTSGNLAGQAAAITDYDGATKMLTYTTVTEAPSAPDTFVIV